MLWRVSETDTIPTTATARNSSSIDHYFQSLFEQEDESGNLYEPLPVRCIPEGRGGTFAFANVEARVTDDPTILHPQPDKVHGLYGEQHIAIRSCYTCVGVYFQIGDDRCFCAHINASVKDVGEPATEATAPHVYNVKHAILAKLDEYCSGQDWTPADVRKETVILVGPNIRAWESGVSDVGQGIVLALLEFLDVSEGDINVNSQAHGFVLEPGRPGRMGFLRFDSHWGEMRLPSFTPVDDLSLSNQEWAYSVESGWGLVYEGYHE